MSKFSSILSKVASTKGSYKTKLHYPLYEFNKDFVHLKLDAVEYLVMLEIKTLGFDYLSVKKFGRDDEVHEMLIDNMTLFEGLNLTDVPEGEYTFLS